MIDAVVNETGGLTLVHDEERLGACAAVEIDGRSGRTVLVLRDGSRRDVGVLERGMLAWIGPGTACRIVRMSGWRIASAAPLKLRHRT